MFEIQHGVCQPVSGVRKRSNEEETALVQCKRGAGERVGGKVESPELRLHLGGGGGREGGVSERRVGV